MTAAGTGTPTLPQLLQYHSILCWTNSTPADNVAWGDVLADYVDAGGGVVVAVFANSTTTAGRNIAGRWQPAYEVIPGQAGNASGANHTMGTVHVPAHPLMGSVPTFQGGTVASRPNSTLLAPGAVLIAEWSNGKTLVAAGPLPRRVDLGFFPPHTSCSGSGWAIGGEQLMANALLYTAGAAMYGTFGNGCAGTSGAPTLVGATGQRPTIGMPFTMNLGNLVNNAGSMVTGFSATAQGPITLPFNLQLIGFGSGCSLLSELFLVTPLTGSNNTATFVLPVPMNPTLAGLQWYNQALSSDPTATGGLTVSNGGVARVGIR